LSAPEPRQDRSSRTSRNDDHWIDRWSIPHRVALAVGLPVALLVIAAVLVGFQLQGLGAMQDELDRERAQQDATVALEQSFTAVVRDSQAYVLTGDTQNRSAMETSIGSFQDQLGDFEPSAEDRPDYDHLETNASSYIDIVRRAQGHVEEGDMEQARTVLTGSSAVQTRTATLDAISTLQTAERRDVQQTQQALGSERSDLFRWLGALALIGVGGAGFVGYDASRRTRTTMDRLAATLDERLDRLAAAQADERDAIEAQAEGLAETRQGLDQVHGAADTIEDRLSEATQMAGEIEAAAEAGNGEIEAAVDRLDTVDANVGTVAERVLDIGEELELLEDVADDVTAMAEQIDMLALNASVEAPRGGGGSQGLGEVRDLASRSKQRGGRIQTIVETARQQTDAAALAIEEGAQAVEDARSRAQATDEALTQVEGCLEDGLEEMAAIEQLADDQVTAIGGARDALRDANARADEADRVRQRADRLVAGLEEIADSLRGVS
jgi:CHASE3 domain sensor protein